ncbi:MAG: hypothetical protein JWP83_1284 [Mycobacterium sp.]|jgi:hypothetical protein|uniref:hypothetical protein n=1 Tax=Mycobacterium sp. TaxID=1785 RepID=UPI0026177528|nr:hypothetical protein [Mycobacterium sp.]MCW2660132.1 hypothetical protein [Mycobacterium sp.]
MPANPTYPDAMPATLKINPAYPRVPLPAGAVRVDDWELGRTGADGMPNVYRGFAGTRRVVGCDERDRDIAVEVTGLQHGDSSVERTVSVSEIDGPPLTPATARELGTALIAAADETDEMAGCDQIEAADDPALTGIPLCDLIEEAVRRLGSLDEVARQVGVPRDEFEAFMGDAKTADAT